jgi:hypothetical protein
MLGLLPGVRQRWIETPAIGTHNFSVLSDGNPRNQPESADAA